MYSEAIHPFTPSFDSVAIDDLLNRLQQTRYPNAETVEDWSQGLPLSYHQELIDYWKTDYDPSRVPNRLRRYDNFKTEISNRI